MVFIFPILIGLVIGFLTGGSLARAQSIRFRALPLLVAALLIQVAIFSPILGAREVVHEIGPYIYIGTMLATLVALAMNIRVPGIAIIAIGSALNTIVIIANGGFMPSPESALRDAGRLEEVREDASERADGSYVLSNSTIADEQTRLLFLGDVMPMPASLPLANVISIGDVFISLGAAVAVLAAMHARPRGAGTVERDEALA